MLNTTKENKRLTYLSWEGHHHIKHARGSSMTSGPPTGYRGVIYDK